MYVSHIVNNYYQPIKKTYPNVPLPEVKLTKSAMCLRSLHDLKISLVYYNDITKKTCLISVLDQNLFIFPA